tara:strand:+ start:177 stop:656 length:480 start_codon:yes stop_codon:yes gene_type:complete
MPLIQFPDVKMNHDEQIVPLSYVHLQRLKLKEHEQLYANLIPNYLDYVWDCADPKLSWAAIGKGRVVAVFGLRSVWPGLMEVWMLPSEGIEQHAISFIRGSKSLIDIAIGDYDVNRLQICVKKDNTTAFRFAKALGFEVESTMTKFGPEGADYYMMVRF